ncbi:DUF4397 domain-containing protein [Tahibacter harae]|uniref:DUF4397 domain-containing protein n=1 Tax=Tahibacter harae TaxID=2963937 RepID=A0ABT1QVR5_9GAMM|nr:DUF4397 domain-containing protein [Tahibacter harae]MCQ4166375.1 DUF4397 domain-containing protein [Tahibacter harae]
MKSIAFLRVVIAAAMGIVALDAAAATRVRVAHFAPFASQLDATAVDIAVNGTTVLRGVKFGQFSEYLPLAGGAGTYDVKIFPQGSTTPAISANVRVDDGDYTVAAIGNGAAQPLELQALVDDNSAPPAGSLKLRVLHAAPFAADSEATRVSVRTDAGDIVGGLSSVPYKVSSTYLTLPAATYNLKVSTPDGVQTLIDAAPVTLPAGAVITVAAVGDGRNQPLGFVAVPVGALPTETPVDRNLSGHWFNPETPGQGITFFPVPAFDNIVGTWYTYDTAGNQVWYGLDASATPGQTTVDRPGTFDGREATFAVYRTSGGRFNDPRPIQLTPAGSLVVTFANCKQATARYRNGNTDVTFPLTNLAPGGNCQ